MTKVYEALNQAEAKRRALESEPMQGNGAHQPEDLDQLREILFGHLFRQLDDTIERLDQQITEQTSTVRQSLGELEKRLEQKISKLDRRTSHGQTELTDQILSQSKLLNESIRNRGDNTLQLTRRTLEELRDTKVDREDFSRLLLELSGRLSGSTKKAGGGEK